MRYCPAVILTLFALTPLIAVAQSATRPTVSGTGADQSGAVAQRATGASKNTAINRYHENDSLNAKTRGRYRLARKPETIPVSTASQFTSALSNAQPGDTILLSGTIQGGRFTTTRSGAPGAPITIRGDGTARVSGSPYALEILHDYYRLENFILENSGKGMVIDNAEHGTVNHVHAMDIQQEAFKLRNQSRYWEFTFCSARRTGLSGDFGEGFYVGQASSNWINNTPDQCAFITFFNCYTFDTVNDGWDIKEGSHDVKVVNCTADFSGGVEPAGNAAHGSAGYYCRADNVQFIKSSVVGLNNGDWGYRYSNTTVGGVDYGSAGNQIKQSAVFGGNVGFIFAEGGTNGVVFDDFTNTSSGGFYATGSATVTIAASSGFSERTWLGEGGGVWGDLDPTVGASGDPLDGSPPSRVAAPNFNPGGGAYSSAQFVAITTSTIGASIRYTTDGSAPTSTSGVVYSGPVTISVTTTLKAIAYKSGMTDSPGATANYTINTGGGSPGKFAIPGSAVTASANDGNVPANTVDGNLGTRWSALGDPQWIQYDLGAANTVSFVKIAWYQGATRVATFDVQLSTTGASWTNVLTGATSSGATTALETYDFSDATARYVRIVGHGNSVNMWNSITETEVWGFAGGGTVAAPSFSPGGGAYTSAQSVTITSATSGATIRYMTDGSTPTSTSGTVYSGPVLISATTTLRAIAYKSGMTDSSVTTATYTISGGDVFTQDISVASGNDDAKQRESGTVVTNSWRHPLGYDGVEQLEIGLRFTGLIIPRNATVTAAYIQFEADKSDSGSSSLTIKAELNASAAAFTTTANNITNRPLTGASVAWSPPAWTQSDRGAAQKTPDLKALVQAIVNQSTWNAGNAIVFVITGTGTRTAEAFESGAANAPQLHVEWQ
jgi:hypothetical protein